MRLLNKAIILGVAVACIVIAFHNNVFAAVKTMPDGCKFDPQYYMQANPDVAQIYGVSDADLYRHYTEYGKKEGRKPYLDVDTVVTLPTLNVFKRIGVVGDSFASGAVVTDGKLGDDYSVSWPQLMGKRNGVHVTNYTRGGFTTATWLMMPEGSFRMLNSMPDDLYILALGLNDSSIVGPFLGENYLGSMKDIKGNKYGSNYPSTFYGNYGRIIEQIKNHAPNAKMVMIYINLPAPITDKYNEAITEIANYYGIPCIDQRMDSFFFTDTYLNMEMGHPTREGHSGMADAFARLIVMCMNNNRNYFYPYVK